MAKHVTSKSWTDADIARLKKLSADGASVNRAAAALNRNTAAIQKMARKYGLSLIGTRQAKAIIRALNAID